VAASAGPRDTPGLGKHSSAAKGANTVSSKQVWRGFVCGLNASVKVISAAHSRATIPRKACISCSLARGHQNMNSIIRLAGDVIVQSDISDVERDMLFSVPRERLLQFRRSHLWQYNIFDNNRMTIYSGGNSVCFDLVFVEDARDRVRHGIQFHNLAIND